VLGLGATKPRVASPVEYRPDVDGLRAVAVLLVVGYHALPERFPGGFTGVDVFFVISGFLITGIVLKELQGGTFSFRGFYARRVRRIFPALVAAVTACLALGWFTLFPAEYQQLAKHAAAGLGFVSNLVLFRDSGYFDTAAEAKPLLHLWSLGVEEQFYFVWPLLVLLTFRHRWGRYLMGALVVASFALNVVTARPGSAFAYFMPMTRLWSLALGGALAHFTVLRPDVPGLSRWEAWLREAASAAGAALILGGAFLLSKEAAYPGWRGLIPAVGAFLLVAGGARTAVNRVLSTRALVFVGLLSYPLYLFHWPALAFVHVVEVGRPSPLVRLGAVLASAVLAWLTFAFLERPIRRLASRRARPVVAGLLAGSVALTALSVYLFVRGGVPNRLTPDTNALLASTERAARTDPRCFERFPAAARLDFCRAEGNLSEPVIVVGDSLSQAIFSGVAAQVVPAGGGVVHLAASGCGFLPDVVLPGDEHARQCWDRWEEILRGVEQVRPRLIVFANFGERYFGLEPEAFTRGMGVTLDRLRAKGLVVHVLSAPSPAADPVACHVPRPLRLSTWLPRCERDSGPERQSRERYRQRVLALASERGSIPVLDPADVLCAGPTCVVRDAATILYADDVHLSDAGGRWVMARLASGLPSLDR